MKFAKFIPANSCFSFFTTILEKNNNSFIHRFSHYFPSFQRFDIQLLHLLRYEYSVCYLLALPSPFHPPFHPQEETAVNVIPKPPSFAGESSPSSSTFTSHHPQPPSPDPKEARGKLSFRVSVSVSKYRWLSDTYWTLLRRDFPTHIPNP